MSGRQKLSILFGVLAVAVFQVMIVVVAVNYVELKITGELGLTSFPPETAFVYCIPFVAGIVLLATLSAVFYRADKREKQVKSLINNDYKQNRL